MKLKSKDFVPTSDRPFFYCKLGREKYGKILTELISSANDGFVLAINNKWGTGKSTFVKMWQQQLASREYETIYFNAWENDFEDSPLAAIMGELKQVTDKAGSEKLFKDMLEAASVFAKNLVPQMVGKYIETKTGIKDLGEFAENASKGFSDMFSKDVEEYKNKKISIRDFRKKLKAYLDAVNNNKPLIFIIDELDRCRPNYAVSLLEQLKHFFNVDGIVFVLSIDKEQLGHAVCGVYGSEKIDSQEYLRRFIDIEYSLPQPSLIDYCNLLYKTFEFSEYFRSDFNRELTFKDSFLNTIEILSEHSQIPLRVQEKIFAHARFVLNTFTLDESLNASLFVYLIYLKIYNLNLFNSLKFKEIKFLNVQEKTVARLLINNPYIIELEANLVFYYNIYTGNTAFIVQRQEVTISSLIDNKNHDGVNFKEIIKKLHDNNKNNNILQELFNRIDMIEIGSEI